MDYAIYPVEDTLWTTLYILWRISCGLRYISCGGYPVDYAMYPVEDILWTTLYILWRYPVEYMYISCGGYPVEYMYISCGGYPVDHSIYPVEDILWTTVYILWRISCGKHSKYQINVLTYVLKENIIILIFSTVCKT